MALSDNTPPKIAIVVGEASGDMLGAGLVTELLKRDPNLHIEGIIGPRMQAAGAQKFESYEKLNVVGLLEPLKKLPSILHLRKKIIRHVLKENFDLFIGIDAPEFNIAIEAKLKKRGVKTIQYCSPQVWGWRTYRANKIINSVDRLLTLFPFETDFYRDYFFEVDYVGHPLADDIPLTVDPILSKELLGISTEHRAVALMPGSRVATVRYLAPIFLETAKLCHQEDPSLLWIVPLADDTTRALFEKIKSKVAPDLPIQIFVGKSREVIAAADAVLSTSGTSTLEVMLLKRPMVVSYILSGFTYFILKYLVHSEYIALPNLIANKMLVPELIQDEADPRRLAPALMKQINDSTHRERIIAVFTQMHMTLKQDTNKRAADVVLEELHSV